MCCSWKFCLHTLYHQLCEFMCMWRNFLIAEVDLTTQLRLMKEQLGIVPCTPIVPERKRGPEGCWEALLSTSFRLHVREMKACKWLPVIVPIKEQLRLGSVVSG